MTVTAARWDAVLAGLWLLILVPGGAVDVVVSDEPAATAAVVVAVGLATLGVWRWRRLRVWWSAVLAIGMLVLDVVEAGGAWAVVTFLLDAGLLVVAVVVLWSDWRRRVPAT